MPSKSLLFCWLLPRCFEIPAVSTFFLFLFNHIFYVLYFGIYRTQQVRIYYAFATLPFLSRTDLATKMLNLLLEKPARLPFFLFWLRALLWLVFVLYSEGDDFRAWFLDGAAEGYGGKGGGKRLW